MGLNNPGGTKGAVKPVICCPVVNGGFETGDFTGWHVIDSGGSIAIITGGAPEGTYYARLTKTNAGEIYLGPPLPPLACSPYGCSLIFDYKSTCPTGGFSSASAVTNVGSGYLRYTVLSPVPNWTECVIPIYAFPAASYLYLWFAIDCTFGGSGVLEIDNVRVMG